MDIKQPQDFSIKTNLLENRYVTDGVIFTVDETIFNEETRLFLVISLNTRAILGYIQTPYCIDEHLLIELYTKILDDYEFQSTPCFIHSDMEPSFNSEKVSKFLESNGIYLSSTLGGKNQNQLSESLNNRVKYIVTQNMLKDTNSKGYREFAQTLPAKYRFNLGKHFKCTDKEFRKLLFESKFFKDNRQSVIYDAIKEYNRTDFIEGITREQAQYYDRFVKGRDINNTRLIRSDDFMSKLVEKDNIDTIKQVKTKISEILESDFDSEEKIANILGVVVEKQDTTLEYLQKGFIGMHIQNVELQEKLDSIQEELKVVTEELQEKNRIEQIIIQRREKRKNRKRAPLREPITEQIYEFIIQEAEQKFRQTYCGARLRLALALLAITGVRVSELLKLKISDIETLFQHKWIAVDRAKRGPSSHKAYLTRKGARILKQRSRDFEIILYSKDSSSYVFTQEHVYEPLTREAFTRTINEFLTQCSDLLPNKPYIKSHSFRAGFITELWRNTGDIEFVRQAIGHAKLDTTSRYVQNLSPEELRERMLEINNHDDLHY